MRVNSARISTLAVGIAMATVLTGCGSSGSEPGTGASAKASGPVKVDFWGWAPGYSTSVDLFNASHKDVRIVWHEVAPGSKGGYTKMLTATKAGNGPCLAQVGYETLPSFAAAGALQDVGQYAGGYSGDFAGWSWNQVTISGQVYGVPVDTAPMALIYRKDLFATYGITAPPVTWAQYAADAAKVHAADPSVYLGDFGNDAYNYAGLDWQAGAKWFGTTTSQWQVSVDSAAGGKVASY